MLGDQAVTHQSQAPDCLVSSASGALCFAIQRESAFSLGSLVGSKIQAQCPEPFLPKAWAARGIHTPSLCQACLADPLICLERKQMEMRNEGQPEVECVQKNQPRSIPFPLGP